MRYFLGVLLFLAFCAVPALGDQHPPTDESVVGNALQDARNPIVALFGGDRLGLWSFRPVVQPAVPEAVGTDRVRNPIDAFIQSKLTAQDLRPSPEASKRTLAKRLYYDLTGLPPSPEAMMQFLQDDSPDAYEKLVDQLLASREFAEHWGRQWLDVVRYSDSAGFDWDELRPNAWRYRDYVIDAFDSDKPFDQFIREQLAGDEMIDRIDDQRDQELMVATGFLRIGPSDKSAKLFNEDEQNHAMVLADVTETTAAAFLGMTLGCCRCHDHKSEPLSHEDHYRMRAFFANVDFESEVAIDPDALREEIQQHNEAVQQDLKQMSGKMKSLPKESPELAEAEKRVEELKKKVREMSMGMVASEPIDTPPETHVLDLGDVTMKLDPVSPGIPSFFDPAPTKAAKTIHPKTSGRRTALANWVASADNPLTARVAVNRLWQGMFGKGLVASANDFGFSGTPPSNQALLDWMAAEFVNDGWSLKKTLRRIACSATYRQSAYPPEAIRLANESIDAENQYLWRANPKRLRAEMLRDSLLQVAGVLQPSEGGPPVWPDLPPEVLAANPSLVSSQLQREGSGWYTSPPGSDHVRAIYLVQKRSVKVPFMEVFDLPDNFTSASERCSSTVAPQALTMLNSEFTQKIADEFAHRIETLHPSDPQQQVISAVQVSLVRDPTHEEIALYGEAASRIGLAGVCRILLNCNEFIYVD